MRRPEWIPPLATFTVDVAGNERRFTPFAHGSAPEPDQAAVRAVNAVSARAAVEMVGTPARRLALPLAVAVAFAVAMVLARLSLDAHRDNGILPAIVAGYILGLVTYAIIRQHCIWRYRGYAARVPLLTIGRCGACGHLLRGAKIHVSTGGAEPLELCQCGECGSLWVAEARDHPRHAVTHERVDLPECEGLDVLRARMRLRRALRARPSDFVVDATGEPRYIAHMDGAHRTGTTAFIRDALDNLGALALSLIVAFFLFGCCGNVLSLVSRAIFMADPNDKTSVAMSYGVEAVLALLISIAGFAAAAHFLTPRHRVLQSNRILSKGDCPCCTMTLPPPGDDGTTRCTCCEAVWRP